MSIRAVRAEKVSVFVGAIIDGDAECAAALAVYLDEYPIVLTRDLGTARRWLRERRRANEHSGLLASSNGLRLKPEGIFVKAKIEPPVWFLALRSDVRSSETLEDVAPEFEVHGLELDWSCVCWYANLRHGADGWRTMALKGTRWQQVSDPQRRSYLLNAYRVLLTRARQDMVIFVPEGDVEDATRAPEYYDGIFHFPSACGVPTIEIETEPVEPTKLNFARHG